MHRAIALIVVLVALQSVASAQLPSAAQEQPNSKQGHSGEFGSPTEEMLRRAEIRREEETHKDMVERADEAVQIGDELLTSYRKNSSLTRDDLKRLERLPKNPRKNKGGGGGPQPGGERD